MIEVIQHIDDRIDMIAMKNEQLEVVVSNYGCTIIKVIMADKNGHKDDVVLGYDDFTQYQTLDAYLGALVGRVANRIKKGEFTLHGQTYHLAVNNGPNHLHGGIKGFSYQVFDYTIQDDHTLVFHYLSPDGQEGYPGDLDLTVTYTLIGDTLKVHYQATSTADTLINITNHSYFNLSGHKENIYQHTLQIHASQFACVDSDGLTTGELKDVAEKLNIAKSTLCEYENNNIDPPASKLIALLQLYQVEPFMFLKNEDQYINISHYSKKGKLKAILLDLEEKNKL